MGLIEVYIIFAITTALATIYELILPVLRQLKTTNPELIVVKNWKLTVFSFFIMSLVIAPLVLIPCLWPSRGEEFRKTLYTQLQNNTN